MCLPSRSCLQQLPRSPWKKRIRLGCPHPLQKTARVLTVQVASLHFVIWFSAFKCSVEFIGSPPHASLFILFRLTRWPMQIRQAKLISTNATYNLIKANQWLTWGPKHLFEVGGSLLCFPGFDGRSERDICDLDPPKGLYKFTRYVLEKSPLF